MRPRVPRVLLLIVMIVRFSTTTSSAATQQSQLLILRLLPEEPAENPDRTLNKWRTVQSGEDRAPQIEIHLLKGRVSPDENWYYLDDDTGYKYFGPNYKYNLATDERKLFARLKNDEKPGENAREDEDENVDDYDDIVMPDQTTGIDSRNIIVAPTFCRDGEKPDSIGRCRPVLE
ncbi:uncharacterized protein LOC116848069 [Odontomachus brunneus]|uniref:uncharacterized protein LOC116848069 n=1 Tax=Odontomachus brunneus TaxID=486640 RepID=UPI0013F264A2|nr:uncharacterized protein LOC116848069 [Odontomachus brunneus]